jgi:hypothetical protein
MWRTLLTAALVYGCGHPGLGGWRPALLDGPLQTFHQLVNAAAGDGKKMIASLDDSPYMRSLRDYIAGVEAQLRQQTADGGRQMADGRCQMSDASCR